VLERLPTRAATIVRPRTECPVMTLLRFDAGSSASLGDGLMIAMDASDPLRSGRELLDAAAWWIQTPAPVRSKTMAAPGRDRAGYRTLR
jgi:hypothetical protein